MKYLYNPSSKKAFLCEYLITSPDSYWYWSKQAIFDILSSFRQNKMECIPQQTPTIPKCDRVILRRNYRQNDILALPFCHLNHLHHVFHYPLARPKWNYNKHETPWLKHYHTWYMILFLLFYCSMTNVGRTGEVKYQEMLNVVEGEWSKLKAIKHV